MKTFLSLFFLLITLTSFSQRQRYNVFSMEQGLGAHVPLLPADNISRSKFINTNHFHIGARYMVYRDLGVRVQYAYNGFQNKDNSSSGTTFNRINVEAVYNLRHLFHFLDDYENIGILANGGLGYTKGRRLRDNGTDRIANLQFGFMPMIKLSDNAALFADGSFVANVKQNYHFTGAVLNSTDKTLYGTISVGFIFYFGKYRDHADWY